MISVSDIVAHSYVEVHSRNTRAPLQAVEAAETRMLLYRGERRRVRQLYAHDLPQRPLRVL